LPLQAAEKQTSRGVRVGALADIHTMMGSIGQLSNWSAGAV